MKKASHYLIMPFLLLAVAISTTSCEKDETPSRDKFLGTYDVVENCGLSGLDNYTITISESANADNEVVITNLYAFGGSLTGTVSGNNITIPSQIAGNLTFSATGSISGDVLSLTFDVSDGMNSDTCTAECTKQ